MLIWLIIDSVGLEPPIVGLSSVIRFLELKRKKIMVGMEMVDWLEVW